LTWATEDPFGQFGLLADVTTIEINDWQAIGYPSLLVAAGS